MIQVREFTQDDLPLIRGWFRQHGHEGPPDPLLKLGRIAEHDGLPVAAAFLFLDATSSGLAWLAWPVCRADVRPVTAGLALKHVIACCEGIARTLDYGIILAAPAKRLGKFLQRLGYVLTDSEFLLSKILQPV